MKYRFQQMTPRGLWTSSGVFESEYSVLIRQTRKFHVSGQPRAAIDACSGRIIFALDEHGNETDAAAWAGIEDRIASK